VFQLSDYMCDLAFIYLYIYIAKNGSQIEDTYTSKVVAKVNDLVAGTKSPFFMRLEVDVSLLAHLYSKHI
jgi:hypothetical protein